MLNAIGFQEGKGALQQMKYHLATVTPKSMNQVLSGEKTIEIRLYSSRRSHPAMSCESGDVIFFKRTSRGVEAKAIAGTVLIFPALDNTQLLDIYRMYGDRICADDSFWIEKRFSVQGVLIEIVGLKRITIAKADLPSSREGWITQDEPFVHKPSSDAATENGDRDRCK